MAYFYSGGRYSHEVSKERQKPFNPPFSLADMMAYPEQKTGNQLLDAVSEALHAHLFTTGREVAQYLNLNQSHLTGALQIMTGCSLADVVGMFVWRRIDKYLKAHPDDTLDEVAKATGFSTKSSVAAVYQKYRKGTPRNRRK